MTAVWGLALTLTIYAVGGILVSFLECSSSPHLISSRVMQYTDEKGRNNSTLHILTEYITFTDYMFRLPPSPSSCSLLHLAISLSLLLSSTITSRLQTNPGSVPEPCSDTDNVYLLRFQLHRRATLLGRTNLWRLR